MDARFVKTSALAACLALAPAAAQASETAAETAAGGVPLVESVDVSPDARALAEQLSAVILGLGPDADPTAIQAAISAAIVESGANEWVVADALSLVLEGEWAPGQAQAIYALFSVYSPEDVRAPNGGYTPMTEDEDTTTTEVLPPPPVPPSGGGSDYES